MRKILLLTLVLFAVFPFVYAQTGCCGNPDVQNSNDNFCANQIEKSICCQGLTEQICSYFFKPNTACSVSDICNEEGCLVCQSQNGKIGIFGLKANTYASCLFGPGLINPQILYFNTSITTQAACNNYASTYVEEYENITIQSISLNPANPSKTITITGGKQPITITGSGSNIKVEARTGTYSLTISADGYTSETKTGNLVKGTPVLIGPITLTTTQTGSLRGTVKSGTNNVRAEVVVNPGPNNYTTYSNTNGQYEFPSLLPGRVIVLAKHETLGSDLKEAIITGGQITTLNFNLQQGGIVYGRIKNTENQYLEDVQVRIGNLINKTNSNGYFIIKGVPQTPAGQFWTLQIQKEGYLPYQLSFSIADGETKDFGDITISRTTPQIPTGMVDVEIILKDNEGNPLPYTQINIYKDQSTTSAITNATGTTKLKLYAPATYRFVINKDRYYPYDANHRIEEEGQLTISLLKKPYYTITGVVKDSENLNPITGATVKVGDLITTTSSGSFSINVPAGQRTIYITKAGYSSAIITIENLLSNYNAGTIYLIPESCKNLNELSTPNITDVRQIKDQIVLSFSNRCPANKFYIKECSGNGCDPKTIAATLLDSPYTKTNIKGSTTYCFAVEAQYELDNVVKTSAIRCITTGPQECIENNANFCYGQNVVKCENNNITIVDNCTSRGEFCYGARCMYPSACDLCSRPFGIFSLPIQSIKVKPGAVMNTLCSDLTYCYKDFTRSSADKYDECLNVDSCYYYKSKEACENDQNKCKKGPCEWIPSKYDELGQGVCRPVDEKKQDCRRCSEEFNRVFGSCNKETCKLYGNCYFKPSTKECLNKEDVSCDMYESEEDCTNQIPAIVNVTWFGNDSKYLGDNRILQRSNDSVSLGLCKWNSTLGLDYSCFKDADNSNTHDCNFWSQYDKDCNFDFEAPETMVVYSDLTNRINFNYSVKDNKYLKEDIKTYYCVAEQNGYCDLEFMENYPKTPAQGRIVYNAEKSGVYNVYYFSEDQSNNLEEVKKITVNVDMDPPIIEPKILKYVESRNNQLVLDLVVKLILLSDHNEAVFCSGSLLNSPITSTEYSDSNTALTEWHYSYRGFTQANAGTYTFRYECKDAAGNSVSDDLLINIDPDATINSPTQQTFNFTNNIPISIKTQDRALCEYFDGNNYIQMIPDETKTTHSANVSIPTTDVAYKEYPVRCTLEASNSVVQGSPADIIKVAVDVQAPTTKTYRNDEPYDITFGGWINNENSIKLECSDFAIPGRNQNPKEFGCSQTSIFYCEGNNCIPEQKTKNPYRPRIEETTKICYYSVDNGGNKEFTRCADIKLDKIAPMINNLKIYDPNSETLEEIATFTKKRYVALTGEIPNEVNASSSPIKEFYLEVNGQRDNLTGYGINPIIFRKDFILLNANSENSIVVVAIDEAGNIGRSEPRKIIQDSEGPIVSNIRMISDLPAWFSSQTNVVEFGYDSTIRLEAQDNISIQGINPVERVSSVWVEDIYGKIVNLERNQQNRKEWSGRLETSRWPFGLNNIKIYSNDTLGNVKVIEYTINLIDDIPPRGNLAIETPEGFEVGIETPVPAGKNYVILNASEPLSGFPIFKVQIGNYIANVSLIARTLQGDNWLAEFEVPSGIMGLGNFIIQMNDSHGVIGNQVTGTQFYVNSIIPTLPNISYYVNSRMLTLPLSTANHTVKLNNKIIAVNQQTTPIIKLNPGENEIYVKSVNGFNVNEITYKVFYDDFAPIVIDNSVGAQKSNNVYAVVYERGSGLKNNTKMTIINNTQAHNVVGYVNFVKAGDNYRFDTTLPEGNYIIEITGSDEAGNNINFRSSVLINASAPQKPNAPVSGNVLGNRIFVKTAPGNLVDVEGQPAVKVTQNGFNYYYYVVVDNEAPSINLENNLFTSPGKNYDIHAIVYNEQYPLNGFTRIDNSDISIARSTKNLYNFVWNVPNKNGTFTITTKLTDIAGNEGTATSTVVVDNSAPQTEKAEVSFVDVELINGTYLTRNNTIKFIGKINNSENDIEKVYVERNGNLYKGNVGQGENAEFEVNVVLLGTTMTETRNNLILTFEDRGGNIKSIPFVIIKDLKPPELIKLEVPR